MSQIGSIRTFKGERFAIIHMLSFNVSVRISVPSKSIHSGRSDIGQSYTFRTSSGSKFSE